MRDRDTEKAQVLIGRAVRTLREQRGLTLEQLAPLAGISYQYLSGLENGRQNFSISVLDALARVLRLPLKSVVRMAYDNGGAMRAPRVTAAHFRRAVPLPGALTYEMLEAALNRTQEVFFLINRNMLAEVGCLLQDLIQGNNFSGLVSNVLTDALDQLTVFKHNHEQRYPDLVCAESRVGLEVKATTQIGKGGESHNGHSGWHTVACFERSAQGIEFIHVMFAQLRGHGETRPDWAYVGSKVNEETGSRRTETYNTTLAGTTKLRDGSAFLKPERIDFSRWRQARSGAVPAHSIFARDDASDPKRESAPKSKRSRSGG